MAAAVMDIHMVVVVMAIHTELKATIAVRVKIQIWEVSGC